MKRIAILLIPLAALLLSACGDNDEPTGTGTDPGPVPGQWYQRVSGTTEHINSVAWDGSLFVAVGWDIILTSRNGLTWTEQAFPASLSWRSVVLKSVVWSERHQLFVAVGADAIVTSPNGVTWTARELGLPLTAFLESAVAFDTLLLVSSYNPVYLLVSHDGVTWAHHDAVGPFDKMCASDTMVLGACGTNPVKVRSSVNGIDWTPRLTTDSLVYCVTRFEQAGLWIAAGHWGFVTSSPDGLTWTRRDAGAGDFSTLLDACAGGDQCVVVGHANGPGLILSTADGSSWTRTQIDSVGWLNGVAASPTQFVVVGEHGVILTMRR